MIRRNEGAKDTQTSIAAQTSVDAEMASRNRSKHRLPFVGRTDELVSLNKAIEDAGGGHGSVLMVCGEPGIGKTTIAKKACDIAGGNGFDVAWGSCYTCEGSPIYWPWVQILRALIASRGVEAIRGLMGVGAPIIAETLPSLSEHLPQLSAPKPMEDTAAAKF